MAGRLTRERLRRLCSRFLTAESGATAIEYALIAGLVAIALVPILLTLRTTLTTMPGWAKLFEVLTGGP